MKEDKFIVSLVSEDCKNDIVDSSVFDKIIGQEEACKKLPSRRVSRSFVVMLVTTGHF